MNGHKHVHRHKNRSTEAPSQPLCVKGFSQTKGLSSKTNSGKHGNGNERDVETDASARSHV